jgi:hypothetical protein
VTDAPTERAEAGGWAKLRPRTVVQWGFAYAAGAWLLLQVFGFAADAFEWPAIAKRFAMLASVIGLRSSTFRYAARLPTSTISVDLPGMHSPHTIMPEPTSLEAGPSSSS